MNSFSNDIEEITFMLREDQLSIKNFVDVSNGININIYPIDSLPNSIGKFKN
jgi:hypothetical protein